MKAFKISLFVLILIAIGNINKSFAITAITDNSKMVVNEQSNDGVFLAKAKTLIAKVKKKINKNLKYTIILWLLGGLLIVVGGFLSLIIIGVPILILGVIVMFSGTFFFYKWIASMLKE